MELVDVMGSRQLAVRHPKYSATYDYYYLVRVRAENIPKLIDLGFKVEEAKGLTNKQCP